MTSATSRTRKEALGFLVVLFFFFSYVHSVRTIVLYAASAFRTRSIGGGRNDNASGIGLPSNPNVISPHPKMGPHKVSAEQQSSNRLANETFLKNEVAANLGDAT